MNFLLCLCLVLFPAWTPLHAEPGEEQENDPVTVNDIVQSQDSLVKRISSLKRALKEDGSQWEAWQLILALIGFTTLTAGIANGVISGFEFLNLGTDYKNAVDEFARQNRLYDNVQKPMLDKIDKLMNTWVVAIQKVYEEVARSEQAKAKKKKRKVRATPPLEEAKKLAAFATKKLVKDYNQSREKLNEGLPASEKIPELKFVAKDGDPHTGSLHWGTDPHGKEGRIHGFNGTQEPRDVQISVMNRLRDSCRFVLNEVSQSKSNISSRRRRRVLVPFSMFGISFSAGVGFFAIDNKIESQTHQNFNDRMVEEQIRSALALEKAKSLRVRVEKILMPTGGVANVEDKENALREFNEIIHDVLNHNRYEIIQFFKKHSHTENITIPEDYDGVMTEFDHSLSDRKRLDKFIRHIVSSRLQPPNNQSNTKDSKLAEDQIDYITLALIRALGQSGRGEIFEPSDIVKLVTAKREDKLEVDTYEYLMEVYEIILGSLFKRLGYKSIDSSLKPDLIDRLTSDTLHRIRGNKLIQRKAEEIEEIETNAEEGVHRVRKVPILPEEGMDTSMNSENIEEMIRAGSEASEAGIEGEIIDLEVMKEPLPTSNSVGALIEAIKLPGDPLSVGEKPGSKPTDSLVSNEN